MAQKPFLKDPVEDITKDQQAENDKELANVFDISQLKIADFKATQLKDARSRHPFEGYPEKKVQVGT